MDHHVPDSPLTSPPVGTDDVVELLVHPALRPALWTWLRDRGLDVGRAPFLESQDGLPLFITTPVEVASVSAPRSAHHLKTIPELFDAVVAGVKTFDVRRDDRGFAVGDHLFLCEFDPDARVVDENQVEQIGAYTGRRIARQVTFVLRGGQFGIEEGFVVMGLGPL